MTQRPRILEEKLTNGENALALLARARKLLEIAHHKADYINEPLRSSLLEDLDELAGLLKRAQDWIFKLIGWLY